MRPLAVCAVLIGMLAALAACSGDSGGETETVRARSFEVTDEDGAVRASLGLFDGEPGFELTDRSGTGRVRISLMPNGDPVMELLDESGVRRAGFEFANGENPALFLRDTEGRLKAGFQVQSDGVPHLFLRNSTLEDGFAVSLLGDDQPIVGLSDPSGRNRVFLGLGDREFNGSLVFIDGDGVIRQRIPPATLRP